MTFTFTDDNARPNLVAENAASGVTVGVTAAAVNDVFEPFEAVTADSISYSTTSTLFDVDSATGVITLVGSLNYETDQSHDVIVTATSLDGTSAAATFTIAVADFDEFDVSAISDTNTGLNTLAENASSGDAVGITASALDADGTTNTITYSLSTNPGSLFAIDSSTGIVTLSSTGSLNYVTATSHDIVVTATSADTSTSTASYTIDVTDVDEFDVSAISDTNTGLNTLAENASSGDAVGITARL